jgi:AcrR family transcriptional regulator
VKRALDEPAATDRRLYDAAVRLFAERGYHGTTVREIVADVGVQPAAFYYHFRSKEHVLREIMQRALEDLNAEITAAVSDVRSPEQQLVAALRAHIAFHATRPLEAFVADSELRALEGDDRRAIVRLRDEYEAIFAAILEAGQAAGAFCVRDVKIETYALMALATAVATWYSPHGRLSVEAVAEIYANFVLDGIRAR